MLSNTSKEFVPKGKHAVTDDLFPTLGGDSDEPKGKKKKGKAVVVQQQENTKDLDKAWKGKPLDFFYLQGADPEQEVSSSNPIKCSQDQLDFVFEHYPEYGQNPQDILIWVYQVLKQHEDKMAQLAAQRSGATSQSSQGQMMKGKKGKKGKLVQEFDYDDEGGDSLLMNAKDLKKKNQ